MLVRGTPQGTYVMRVDTVKALWQPAPREATELQVGASLRCPPGVGVLTHRLGTDPEGHA